MVTLNLKALKRRRKLAGRVRHHGTPQNCMDAHINPAGPSDRMYRYLMNLGIMRQSKPKKREERKYEGGADFFKQKAPEKVGFFRRLFNRKTA